MLKRYNVLGGIICGALFVMILHVFTNVGNASSFCFTANCRVKEDPIISGNYQGCGLSIYKGENRLIKFSDNSQDFTSPSGTGVCYYQDFTLTRECWPEFHPPERIQYNFGSFGDAEWKQTVINYKESAISICYRDDSNPKYFRVSRSCSGEQGQDGPEVE